MSESKHTIKSYSKIELAQLYNVHTSTLIKWILRLKLKNEAGELIFTKKSIKAIRIFTPAEVQLIFHETKGLGLPDKE